MVAVVVDCCCSCCLIIVFFLVVVFITARHTQRIKDWLVTSSQAVCHTVTELKEGYYYYFLRKIIIFTLDVSNSEGCKM